MVLVACPFGFTGVRTIHVGNLINHVLNWTSVCRAEPEKLARNVNAGSMKDMEKIRVGVSAYRHLPPRLQKRQPVAGFCFLRTIHDEIVIVRSPSQLGYILKQ